jgi:hypothetical protein
MPRRPFRWAIGFSVLGLMVCVSLGVAWYRGHPAEPPLPLAADQREYLWQVEHHGLSLNRLGFKPLAQALRQADAKALEKLFAADCAGQIFAQPRAVRFDTEALKVVRFEDDGGPRKTLNRDQLIAQLLEYRRGFSQPPKVSINLMTLSAQDRTNLDSPWEGTCMLRLTGVQGAGHPAEVILFLQYQVPRPTEDNFAEGGWLRSLAINQAQIGESIRFLFRDVTSASGIKAGRFHDNWKEQGPQPPITNTGGVYVCDFNRDGILDILVTDIKRNVLYKGLPNGTFEDITKEVGLPTKGRNFFEAPVAAFADLDGDGWEDLILDHRIYQNVDGQKFVDVTTRCNFDYPGDASGIAIADYDGDGLVDLYVTRPGPAKAGSWIDGKSGDPQGNQLWHNKGNWHFENVTATSGTSGGSRSTFSAAWLDANNDGRPDLFVINEFGNGLLLVNNGDGTFREQLLGEGPGDFGSMGVTTGDVDGDGNIDLYIGNMYSKAGSRVIGNLDPDTYPPKIMETIRHFVTGSQLYRNHGKFQFEPVGKQWQVNAVGWAYGAVLADLDNDGWLDLYATCGFISQNRDDPDG